MKLSTKTIHNLLLNGTSQINMLPIEVTDFLQTYSSIENFEANTTEEVLKTMSIWSINKKISYQKQGAILEQKPNSLSQNKKEPPKLIKEIISAAFLNTRAYYNKYMLKDIIKHFDSSQWIFPKENIINLLNYGISNQELAPYILDILGENGTFLANYNYRWRYIFKKEENINQKEENTINEALVTFAKERIKYNPNNPVNDKWSIDLPHMMTPTLKSFNIKERMYKDAGSSFFNFIIQLLSVVNPTHWIGEDTPNKMKAYESILLELTHKEGKGKKAQFNKEENLQNAILRGLQKAGNHYQDKDLIMAQYSLLILHEHIASNANEYILSNAKSNLFTSADYDILFADFAKELRNSNIKMNSDSYFTDLLKKSHLWSKELAIGIAEALLDIYLNNKADKNDENQIFAYLFPYEYAAEIQDILSKGLEKQAKEQEDLSNIISILKNRNRLAPVYKK